MHPPPVSIATIRQIFISVTSLFIDSNPHLVAEKQVGTRPHGDSGQQREVSRNREEGEEEKRNFPRALLFWVSCFVVGGVDVANSARYPEAAPVYLQGAQRESFHLNLRLKVNRKPVSAGEAGCGRIFREQFL